MFSGGGERTFFIFIFILFVLPVLQLKHTEVERTTKWLKMLKSWDKYKNSEKVGCSPARSSQLGAFQRLGAELDSGGLLNSGVFPYF